MTLNKTEQKILNALLKYQNRNTEQTQIQIEGLSGPLTGLFFSLVDILERGRDELPRTAPPCPSCAAAGRDTCINAPYVAEPEPIRMSAANHSLDRRSLHNRNQRWASNSQESGPTYNRKFIADFGPEKYPFNERAEGVEVAAKVLAIRITKLLTEETNRTEKAQEGN